MARGYFSAVISLITLCICAPANFVIELAREPLAWAFGVAFATIKTLREPITWTPAPAYLGAERARTISFLTRRLQRSTDHRSSPLNVGVAGAGLAFG